MTKLVFLARPYYRSRDPESDDAAKCSSQRDDVEVHNWSDENNMTCKNFNAALALCLNQKRYQYFGILHGDVAPAPGFIDSMIHSLDSHHLDVTHCPCRFKNDKYKVMTALGRVGHCWGPNRLLTTKELARLPQTFDAQTLCDFWGMQEHILLPNTGCMLWKLGPWVETFPGFTMLDRMRKLPSNSQWVAESVSEDFWFGFWAAENGVKVGGTKHTTGHWGRKVFLSDEIGGAETDEAYLEYVRQVEAA